MTTTDRIMESLMVLESKSDSRCLAIHGEDEPQVRAVIEKVLAEQGALTEQDRDVIERAVKTLELWASVRAYLNIS